MSSINKSIHQMITLEELAHKVTPLHRLSPLVKLVITIIYVIIVISFRPEDLNGLLLYAGFPVFFMIIGEIPLKPLILRCLFALPFAIFAGISNLILNRDIVMYIGQLGITGGMISFTSLLLKTVLTVMSVLILVAATTMNDMIYTLVSLRVPAIFVIQLMMTYRYLSVLAEEASLMYHAYMLRAPKEKGIKMKDIGPFLGQLLLRSFDRADRIYHAMLCRGFEGRLKLSGQKKLGVKEWIVMVAVTLLMIMLRFIHVSEMLGRIWLS